MSSSSLILIFRRFRDWRYRSTFGTTVTPPTAEKATKEECPESARILPTGSLRLTSPTFGNPIKDGTNVRWFSLTVRQILTKTGHGFISMFTVSGAKIRQTSDSKMLVYVQRDFFFFFFFSPTPLQRHARGHNLCQLGRCHNSKLPSRRNSYSRDTLVQRCKSRRTFGNYR